MIETLVSHQHNVTLYKCSGNLEEAEINKIMQPYYTGGITSNLLWDFSGASLRSISSLFVKQMASKMGNLIPVRENVKIAIIAPKDLEYGIARMFQMLSDDNKYPIRIKVFRYVGQASQWLLGNE